MDNFLIATLVGVAMLVISVSFVFYTKWKEKTHLVDILEDEITRRQEDTRLWQKLQEQLEAVKKFVEKGPFLNVETLEDCRQAVDDWLGKLMNVLEAEV